MLRTGGTFRYFEFNSDILTAFRDNQHFSPIIIVLAVIDNVCTLHFCPTLNTHSIITHIKHTLTLGEYIRLIRLKFRGVVNKKPLIHSFLGET